jgi:hypothetical protein
LVGDIVAECLAQFWISVDSFVAAFLVFLGGVFGGAAKVVLPA